jgi:hypothetical protein
MIADFQAVFFARSFAHANDFTYKFVPGCNRGLAPTSAVLVAPEPRSALETFDVTTANTSG